MDCQTQILQEDLVCPICERLSLGGKTHPGCQRKYSLDGLWSLGKYGDPLKKIIQKLKYKFVRETAQTLVDLMISYWAKFTPLFFTEIQKDPISWVIIPVPLHPSRQRWRGFNQSGELGKLLAKKMGLRYGEYLKRVKNTKPQMRLMGRERHLNIKNAFELIKNLELKSKNSNILLVDDVWTTGSTLKECGFVLKKGGAKKVWAITIAR